MIPVEHEYEHSKNMWKKGKTEPALHSKTSLWNFATGRLRKGSKIEGLIFLLSISEHCKNTFITVIVFNVNLIHYMYQEILETSFCRAISNSRSFL